MDIIIIMSIVVEIPIQKQLSNKSGASDRHGNMNNKIQIWCECD